MNTTPSMTFAEALANVFNTTKAYGNYRGRARRSEFWYTTLICTIMSLAVDGIGYLVESVWEINGFVKTMFTVCSAYFLIANYSCLCRRMHDIGRSCLLPGLTLSFAIVAFISLMLTQNTIGKWTCIVFSAITFLLLAYVLFLCTKDSDKGKNRYGYSDKYVDPNDNPELNNKFWEEYGNKVLEDIKR